MRALLAIVTLSLAVWVLVLVFGEPRTPPGHAGHTGPTTPGAPTTWTSSFQCLECHAEVGSEWNASWHRQSWTDPLVRAPDQSNDFANTDCIDCHAPRGVFETGIGERVLPRNLRQVEGVDCLTCHLLPDGRVAGTLDDPTAPCRPVARSELADPDFCAGCHNQHGTVDQWRASPYAPPSPDSAGSPALARAAANTRDCVDCHMPERVRSDGRMGRDHRMLGGHDASLLRAAVRVEARVEDGTWIARVTNVGAGHNYPTDERSRASDLFWRRPGETEWRHLYRFRNPYRYEVDLPNTELPAGDFVEVAVEGARADETIELCLAYKLTPRWDDPEHPDPENDSTATIVVQQEFAP